MMLDVLPGGVVLHVLRGGRVVRREGVQRGAAVGVSVHWGGGHLHTTRPPVVLKQKNILVSA